MNHDGWLLLDEAGLGKSSQIIWLAEYLHYTEKLEHCLIVCGVNSLKYNWLNEIQKFSKLEGRVLGEYETKNGKKKIASLPERCQQLKEGVDTFFIITNIETLQSKEFANNFNKSKMKIDMVVLDEAHHAKNPSSLSAKTLLKLKSKRNVALTGTVIMNNPEDAYFPLKWTHNLSCTYTMFKHTYNIYGGFGGVQVIGHKNLELLQSHLKECSLRRLKTEVLDLPPKTYLLDYVEMGTKQQELYDQVKKGIAEELDKLENKNLTILQEMTINLRLRQVTASPNILNSDNIPSAKLDRLEDLLETIIAQGDKALIFFTFKDTWNDLKIRLKQYNPLVCTGDQTDEEIKKNKELFENDESKKVMCCTWQKMGTGHTLTAASYCIFIDTPWTQADFDQASDRIYRIGQKKPVFIITLITKNTYDERVQEILDTKNQLGSYLVDNKIVGDGNIVQQEDYEQLKLF